MTAPVTARMLAEAASAAWEAWGEPTNRDPAIERLDAGVLTQADFWDLVNRAFPCACWSCDGQCGGAVDPGSCGPVEPDENGRPLCVACRELADVIDNEHHGAQVSIVQEQIRLERDVWSAGGALWLSPASARKLAAVLVERAAELDARQ